MSFGVGHRHSSDLALLYLWCRPEATALIQPLAWELPYAAGVALKRPKKKKKRKKEKRKITFHPHDKSIEEISSFSFLGTRKTYLGQ